MINRNVKSVIKTPYQGEMRKVLTVCSGGVLRSPTAATLLCQPPFNFNTRSCGTEDYALVPISQSLVYWADTIICAEKYHRSVVESIMENAYMPDEPQPEVFTLQVPDDYNYMDPELVRIMLEKFNNLFNIGV